MTLAPQPHSQVPPKPPAIRDRGIWGPLAGVIAPVLGALSGALYSAGFVYKLLLLRAFGVPEGLIKDSLQDTLARGYLVIVYTVCLLAIPMLVITLLRRRWAQRRHSTRHHLAKTGATGVSRFYFLLACAVSALTFGIGTGGAQGLLDYYTVVRRVSAGCASGCSAYHVKGRPLIVGVAIMGDADRTLIVAEDGASIVANADLLKVGQMQVGRFPIRGLGLIP
ncbi:hypothetical protein SAMN05192583_0524 [Sphingomonas gellani]|uniref:Uncharacterized protein n=1 Tax=Sphingomonas gellani TaxID=1166340 RepID=A0A1H7Z3V2_9SPHN|nr:hypothetical protein SAMN05192583_0524 [Sphingomonas gellani]